MPVPTLTFSQRTILNVAAATDGKGILVAIRDHLNAAQSPAWNLSVTADGTNHTSGGLQAPYLEIGFASNIGGHPCKLLLACSDDAGLAGPDAANIYTNSEGWQYEYNKANDQLYAALAPKGGTLVADPFGASALYGAAETTQFVRVKDNFAAVQNVWFVDSAEVAALFFETGVAIFGFVWGAVITPLSDLAGSRIDGGVGRIFGLYQFGNTNLGITNKLHSNTIGDFLSATMNNGTGTRDHNPCALAWDIKNGLFGFGTMRGSLSQTGNQAPTWPDGLFRDPIGNLAAPPILACTASGKSAVATQPHLMGVLRQVKVIENAKCRTPVLDATGTVVGYTVSGDLTDNWSAVMFSQS